MSGYEPAVCNIGESEQRKRKRFGRIAAIATVAFLGVVLATGQPPVYHVGTFLLSFMAFLGYLQARFTFCVAHGAQGTYMVPESGGEGTVDEDRLRRQDRLRALEITAYSIGLAASLAIVAYLVQGIALGS